MKDISPHHIKSNGQLDEELGIIKQVLNTTGFVETVPETPTVNRMLGSFERQWTKTANECNQRAAELEKAADELRRRANDLLDARSYLDDVQKSVLYEIESRNRAASLALVNPPKE